MLSAKLLITQNWEERMSAEKLGMTMPPPNQIKTKILFYKADVKRVQLDEDGDMIIVMKDDSYHEFEYEEKMWKELEVFFKINE